MENTEVGREICEGAAEYEKLADSASRTSVRVRVLHLLERLRLPVEKLTTRRVFAEDLQRNPALLGALSMHFDLVFRTPISRDEIWCAAAHGIARVTEHPQLAGFPVGAALAMPTSGRVATRADLTDDAGPTLDDADTLTLFALATNPPRIGAGAALLESLLGDCRRLSKKPSLVAFSPLTGLRARIIAIVDNPAEWRAKVEASDCEWDGIQAELHRILGCDVLPTDLSPVVTSFLSHEAGVFAKSRDYVVGNFHRGLGAGFEGVVFGADPHNSDALWTRAFFVYPH